MPAETLHSKIALMTVSICSMSVHVYQYVTNVVLANRVLANQPYALFRANSKSDRT